MGDSESAESSSLRGEALGRGSEVRRLSEDRPFDCPQILHFCTRAPARRSFRVLVTRLLERHKCLRLNTQKAWSQRRFPALRHPDKNQLGPCLPVSLNWPQTPTGGGSNHTALKGCREGQPSLHTVWPGFDTGNGGEW